MAKTMQEIASLLQQVEFRRRIFGGVDEQDVWRALDGLQAEYRQLTEADRQRYAGLLRERELRIQQLTQQVQQQEQQLKAAMETLRRAGLTPAQPGKAGEGSG